MTGNSRRGLKKWGCRIACSEIVEGADVVAEAECSVTLELHPTNELLEGLAVDGVRKMQFDWSRESNKR